ncbi:hypothetical protein [Azospirillum picis]|uniref:Class I SAM-dependent methyltransferase n=1 Tax=Azospirillum picis TaxID=488438 RepID=A0ABU0MGM9_9PROT|nr:hypothetical protein [Azospirillum picis]MBP2298402.1 hypothetical protein [Azospirillum picis]MDQ0532549.1 hypothetical protein [Azospirillum picis]
MLREAFEYLTTPCDPLARRFGYLAEMVALGARYRRQRRAWAPHVAACRRFIDKAMERVEPGGQALVAGSGRLIEIPLEPLAARFDRVVLLDLLHPRAVRRRVARFPNVELLEMDITGALAPLAAALDRGGPLPERFTAPLPDGAPFRFAVSCNLLSQLPLLPLDAVERHLPDTPDGERLAFAGRMVHGHLDWLLRVADRAALFTDIDSCWLRGGEILEVEDSSWGLSLPAPDMSWLWEIAPAPEQDRRRDLRHGVAGWFDVQTVTSSVPPC